MKIVASALLSLNMLAVVNVRAEGHEGDACPATSAPVCDPTLRALVESEQKKLINMRDDLNRLESSLKKAKLVEAGIYTVAVPFSILGTVAAVKFGKIQFLDKTSGVGVPLVASIAGTAGMGVVARMSTLERDRLQTEISAAGETYLRQDLTLRNAKARMGCH